MWDVGPESLISISAYCSVSQALDRGPWEKICARITISNPPCQVPSSRTQKTGLLETMPIEPNRERRNMIPDDDLSHYRWGSPEKTKPKSGVCRCSWPYCQAIEERSGRLVPRRSRPLWIPRAMAGDDCSDYSSRAACVGGDAILMRSLKLAQARESPDRTQTARGVR